MPITSNAPGANRGAAKCQPGGDRSQHSNDGAETPAANVIAIRPNLRHCPYCGFWLRRGTVMEALHGNTCPKAEEHRRQEARREALRQELAEWRRADRERLRKARGVPFRRPSAPLPARQPHKVTRERLELLRAALAYPELHERLAEAARLPVDALERVAAGRSFLAPTAWRRLLVELDR